MMSSQEINRIIGLLNDAFDSENMEIEAIIPLEKEIEAEIKGEG